MHLKMKRIAVTGASGFIGQDLCAGLRSRGYEVVELTRSKPASRYVRQWQLGEQLPGDCVSADTIIHLASATLVGAAEGAIERDHEGTRLIVEQIRRLRHDGSRHRFIFMSSQSARPGALNAYGRSKWDIECMLDQADEIIVRPGLVYGDQPKSVFAVFEKLTRLPVVPIVSSKLGIQPIHVGELVDCLIQLTVMDAPPKLLKLGAVQPLSFKDALQATAYRAGRSAPLMVPVPIGPVRLVTRMLDQALHLTLTERLDGLACLNPMETESSLKLLGRTLAPFDSRPAAN